MAPRVVTVAATQQSCTWDIDANLVRMSGNLQSQQYEFMVLLPGLDLTMYRCCRQRRNSM